MKKNGGGISAIRQVKPYINKETLISVYNAFVRPYLDYRCEAWDVFGETQSQRLEKLQNRVPGIILNMTNDVNHTIALRALGREPLKIERKKTKGKMMYKILNKMGPQSLTKLFSYKSDKTEYHLRNISSSLCLPKPRTDNMKDSFMYDGSKLWNSILKDISESKSLSSFRQQIAAHTFE